MNILQMSEEQLLVLRPEDIIRVLTVEEVVHIATVLGAAWEYDYDAAKEGRVGMHAELKSGLHSDKFFVSAIMLARKNILRLMARQMVMQLSLMRIPRPDYVVGIPKGATELGKAVGEVLGVPVAEMRKIDGRIELVSEIPDGATVCVTEDFSTRGTAFKEAITEIKKKKSSVNFIPYYPVLLNRGSLKKVSVESVGEFEILPVVEYRVMEWGSANCPFCKIGSKVIKPKASDENWRLITTSQFAQTALE